ncbi:MAG TPA: hypothetical protein VGI86_12435 [Acidimicrobiia bacterium]|jgi:hypothetical protein
MSWKQGIRALAVVALAGTAFAAVPAASAAAPVNGTGTVTKCKFSGAATLSPPLTTTMAPVTTTIKGTLTCNGGTGSGKTLSGGSLLASEKKVQNCTSLAASSAHKIASTVTWKVKSGSPVLSPSKGLLTKMAPTVKGQAVTVDITGKDTSGSFSKAPLNDVLLHGVVKQTVTQLLSACSSKAGLKQLTLLPTSTFQIN